MTKKANKETKMYIYVADVVSVAWNEDRGKLLKHLRGKKSRQKLADEISAKGGECSHQNLKKLENSNSESVSVKVLEAICEALDIPLDNFLNTIDVTNHP